MNAYALVGYRLTPVQQRLTDRIAPHRPRGARWNGLNLSDDEILGRLSALLDRVGHLSIQLIEVTPGLPRRETLIRRFGSIERTYALVGYAPGRRHRQCFDRRKARANENHRDGATRP